jgi:hypothetical protein
MLLCGATGLTPREWWLQVLSSGAPTKFQQPEIGDECDAITGVLDMNFDVFTVRGRCASDRAQACPHLRC